MRLHRFGPSPRLHAVYGRQHLHIANTLIDKKETSVGNNAPPTVLSSPNEEKKPPRSRFKVVITGSTKGIGLELAREFLAAGDQVVISSRYGSNVKSAVQTLIAEFGNADDVTGFTCDVSKEKEVYDLADYCLLELGGVNFWINNAGSNAYQYGSLTEFREEELRIILETNVLGVMLACKEAIRIMQQQEMNGHILNLDGAGANGRATPRFAAYGATKRAINQFNLSLIEEIKQQQITNIGIHNLSPGMCTTDLLMSGVDTPQAKFFINCLAEPPKIPAKYLVPLVRQLPQENSKNGIQSQNLAYLTLPRAYSRIFKRLVFQERKNRFFKEE